MLLSLGETKTKKMLALVESTGTGYIYWEVDMTFTCQPAVKGQRTTTLKKLPEGYPILKLSMIGTRSFRPVGTKAGKKQELASGQIIGDLRRASKGLTVDESGHYEIVSRNIHLPTILNLWEDWHLNTLSAGCSHQRMAGWGLEEINTPCPQCEYKYASDWLVRELPADIQDKILLLLDLA